MQTGMWERAVAFHGHACPGLAIGYRVVEAAQRELGIGPSEDEDLVCVTENDACGVDAIQALLSCTMGKGNLIFRPTGKMAFSFFDRMKGTAVRVYLKASKPEDASRDQWQEQLLTLPIDEVFAFSAPTFEPPERARLFTSITCEVCGESAPEHCIRIQDGRQVCLDCYMPYDRSWFSK